MSAFQKRRQDVNSPGSSLGTWFLKMRASFYPPPSLVVFSLAKNRTLRSHTLELKTESSESTTPSPAQHTEGKLQLPPQLWPWPPLHQPSGMLPKAALEARSQSRAGCSKDLASKTILAKPALKKMKLLLPTEREGVITLSQKWKSSCCGKPRARPHTCLYGAPMNIPRIFWFLNQGQSPACISPSPSGLECGGERRMKAVILKPELAPSSLGGLV